MIMQRVARHLKQEHWTGVFIELLIVVLGVFIGLQVDNWNTARKQRQAETVLVKELRGNLAIAIDIKTAWIKSTEAWTDDLEKGIAVVQDPDHAHSLSAKECFALFTSGINLDASSDNPTLIALMAPDRLDIIHDPQLRAALLTYDSYHERNLIRINRVKDALVIVVDDYPNAFPRHLDLHKSHLSDVACKLQNIRASQGLQNKLLSNLGRVSAILGATRQDLSRLKQLKSEVDAYHP